MFNNLREPHDLSFMFDPNLSLIRLSKMEDQSFEFRTEMFAGVLSDVGRVSKVEMT